MHAYEYMLVGDRVLSISKAKEDSVNPENWCTECAIEYANQSELQRVCRMNDLVGSGMVVFRHPLHSLGNIHPAYGIGSDLRRKEPLFF